RSGSSIRKNGATGSRLRAAQALIAISPPMPAGSPMVRQRGFAMGEGLDPDVDVAGGAEVAQIALLLHVQPVDIELVADLLLGRRGTLGRGFPGADHEQHHAV